MNSIELDMLSYNGVTLPNVPFNRAAILTVESFISSAYRSRLLTERTTRLLTQFIIGHVREFTIMDADPLKSFIGFWEKASITQTGPGTEYMVTFFMELYSIWLSMIDDKEARKMVARLYPKMPKLAMDVKFEALDNYNNSQAYIELPELNAIEAAIDKMSWVTPWIILGHCNHLLLEYLLSVLDRLATLDDSKDKPNAAGGQGDQ